VVITQNKTRLKLTIMSNHSSSILLRPLTQN